MEFEVGREFIAKAVSEIPNMAIALREKADLLAITVATQPQLDWASGAEKFKNMVLPIITNPAIILGSIGVGLMFYIGTSISKWEEEHNIYRENNNY